MAHNLSDSNLLYSVFAELAVLIDEEYKWFNPPLIVISHAVRTGVLRALHLITSDAMDRLAGFIEVEDERWEMYWSMMLLTVTLDKTSEPIGAWKCKLF